MQRVWGVETMRNEIQRNIRFMTKENGGNFVGSFDTTLIKIVARLLGSKFYTLLLGSLKLATYVMFIYISRL